MSFGSINVGKDNKIGKQYNPVNNKKNKKEIEELEKRIDEKKMSGMSEKGSKGNNLTLEGGEANRKN